MDIIEIPQSLIKQYKERKMRRRDIAKKLGLDTRLITKELYDRGLEIWDAQKDTLLPLLKIVSLYEKKKINREQIREKYGLSFEYISSTLSRYGVKRWDRMTDEEKIRIKSEFWDWVYNEHPDPQYASMIYSYNRDALNIARKTR
jgi:hypothetical protein